MSDISLTTSGGSGSLRVAWDFSALSGTTFNVELSRTLNTTTSVIYTLNGTGSKTGQFTDSGAVDAAAPNPPGLKDDSISFTTSSKVLKFSWNSAGSDIGTKYTYTLKVTPSGGSAVTQTVVATVSSTISGYVYKVTDTSEAVTLNKNTDPTTTGTSASVTLTTTTGMKYIQIASYDSVGNVGAPLITAVDIEAPSAPTTVTVNGQAITTGVSQPAIYYDPNGFSIDVTPSTQVRSVEVLYDITFVAAGQTLYSATATPYCTGIEYTGDILTAIPNLDPMTQFVITVKSYTKVGSSLGTKQFVFVLNQNTVKYTLDWSPNSANRRYLNSATDSVKISWNLTASDSTITQYEVYVRSKQTEDMTWGSWKSLGKGTDKFKTVTGITLGYTGNNVYTFAVAGITATATLPKKILPAVYADMFYVDASGTERYTVLAKLPVDALLGVDLTSGYQTIPGGTVTGTNLISISSTGVITGSLGVSNGVNKTTVFPGIKTTGYNFQNEDDITSFEEAVISGFEAYRTTPAYSQNLTSVTYQPSKDVTYYAILVDIPNTDNLLSAVSYTYDGILGLANLGDVTVTYNGPTSITLPAYKSYRLLKFKTLTSPVISMTGSPTPVSTEGGINFYRPPQSVTASLPESMSAYASTLTILTSYDYSDTSGSGTVPTYLNGTPINRVGSITVYSKLRYTYGSGSSAIIKESPESSLSFVLIDTSSELIIPTLSTAYVPGSTGIDLLVTTNVADTSKYTYRIHDTNSDTQYTLYTTETNDSGHKVLRLRFSKEGTYNITVDYSLQGSSSGSQVISFTVYKFEAPTGNIVSLTKATRVSGFSGSQAHSYTATTTDLNAKGYVYKMTYAGGSYFIKEGYKIPLFKASNLSISKYILNEASRQSLISIDGRSTSSVPTTLMTEHDTQTSDLTNIKPRDLPPVPTIITSSPNPIKTNPDESLIALDSITFTIGNKSADCEYSLYLDGVALAEGTPVVRVGAHMVTAVAKSKYNYTVAVKVLKFEVRNPNFILPPRVTFSPLYNHSGSKTITVSGGSSLYGELETATLEYKLSTDNVWKPYSSPVTVTEYTWADRWAKIEVGTRNYAEDYYFSRRMWEYSQGDASATKKSTDNGIYTLTTTTNTFHQYQIHSESGGRLVGKKDSTALLELKVGETYTLSAEVKVNSGSPKFWLELRDNGLKNYNNVVTHLGGNVIYATSDWVRYSVTGTIKPNSDFGHRRIILGYSEIGSISFRRVELTKSTKPTDAGPAPEDIQADIDLRATFIATGPLTFTARKTNQYGQSISTDLVISSAMITPLPVITPNLSHMKTTNGFLAIPAIDQAIGADYTVTVDGYTYTSWSTVRPPNSSSSTVSVVATNRRTGVASSPVTKTINFNLDPAPQYSIPGLQSSLKMIKFPANTPLQLNKADAVADVYIDGRKVEIGQPMFTDSNVNGVHTILIISRNPVNYAIATTSYVININNYSTTDTSYSTMANKRTAILPLNREAGIYDTPGELMIDTRTADLSVVGKNLRPIEITKELRDQINSKDQIIGQVNKTIEYISTDTEALSSTLESLFGSTGIRTITDLTNRISSEIATYQPKLNTAIASLTQTAGDIATLKTNITSRSSTLTTGATGAKSSSQTILSTTYPTSLSTLSANALALLDNLTEVAQDTYNLTTINNIANGKVTTSEYNAFSKKNDQIFSSLQTIVNNF